MEYGSQKRVAILTEGSDVPDLNVAIKAVMMRTHTRHIEIIGIRRGWMGFLHINHDDPGTIEHFTMHLTIDRV